MSKSLRLLMLAAALNITAAGVDAAQTVLFRGAAAGDSVEVVVNGTPTGSTKATGQGLTSVDVKLPVNEAKKAEMDAHVFVDGCPARHIIHIVERNQQPPVRAEGCERREITGVFWVRERSTLVIDVSNPIPTLLLRQGEYDPTAVTRGRESPRGVVLFAGGGWGSSHSLLGEACGDVGGCEGKEGGGAWTAGADMWITRFLAIEGAYVKPRKASFEGAGQNFRFSYFMDAEIFTVAGKVGIPAGPVRVYGRGGAGFHRATRSTTQTNDPLNFTDNDGNPVTVPGGTQTLEVQTEGWSYIFGGGIEGWVSPRFALFGDGSYYKLKGEAKTGTDIPMDGHVFTVVAGVRFKVF
jgi:hypothetical protein